MIVRGEHNGWLSFSWLKLVSSHVWVLVRDIGKDNKGQAEPLWDQKWHASLSVRYHWQESHMTILSTRQAEKCSPVRQLCHLLQFNYNVEKEEWIFKDSLQFLPYISKMHYLSLKKNPSISFISLH